MQSSKVKLVKAGLMAYTSVVALVFVLIQFGILGANFPVSAWSFGTCSSTPEVEATFRAVWGDGAEARWMQEAADSGTCGNNGGGNNNGGNNPNPNDGRPVECTPGQTYCRLGQFNDICDANGHWTAGGNACTGNNPGGTPSGNGGVNCPISYCNDNHAVPPDPNYTGGSCVARTTAACQGHNGAQQGGLGGNNGGNNSSGYVPGQGSGRGTLSDICVTNADCGMSANAQLACNSCPGGVKRCSTGTDSACVNPGLNATQPAANCGGLALYQVQCQAGTTLGRVCGTTGFGDVVQADACGATCENGGITPATGRCASFSVPGASGVILAVGGSGFLGCGNAVPASMGGSGNACHNCYATGWGAPNAGGVRIATGVTCVLEGASCGARPGCGVVAAPPANNPPAQQAGNNNPPPTNNPPGNPPPSNPQTLACGSQCTVGSGPACPTGQACNPGTNTCALNTCIANPASCAPNMCQPASTTAPNFTLDKFVDGPRTYTIGDLIRFGIIITNTGNTTLTTMSFNDSYAPAYLDYVSITGVHVNGSIVTLSSVAVVNETAGTISIANLATHLGNLAPGQTYRLNINFIARAPVSQTINYASATSGPLTRSDNDWVQIINADTDL